MLGLNNDGSICLPGGAILEKYNKLIMNFKGESFDFFGFSEEPGVYNHK